MRTLILAAVTAALLATGCAGPGYLNKKYALASPQAVRLAVLPAMVTFKTYEEFTDNEFLDQLEKAGGTDHECLAPADVRAKLLDNRPYAEAVNKLLGIEYAREDYLSPPSLSSAFPATELEFIRFCLDEADLVLVPLEFKVTSTNDGMTGRVDYRIYDLSSGLLVLENSHTASAAKHGGPGVMMVTRELVAGIADDYKKFILK